MVSDEWSGRCVYITPGRQSRAAAPGCPFCPGGLEADPSRSPPYAFPNRWPALPSGRCEVVVHAADHGGDFAALSLIEVRRVIDVWAHRSRSLLESPQVRYVLVFENRGEAAGATVAHPHSQIFGLPRPPHESTWPSTVACPGCRAGHASLAVLDAEGWRTEVPSAPLAPYCLRLAPTRHAAYLADLSADERLGLAGALIDAVRRLDAVFAVPMPYHLWIEQAHPDAHLAVNVVGLRCAPDRLRILGAAEMATGLFFTPLAPEEAASRLRAATGVPS